MLTVNIIAQVKLPKLGNQLEECEDDYILVNSNGLLKVAVADGATESSFSKEWASILVNEISKEKNASKTILLNRLPKFRKLWAELVNKKQLPWYAEIKLEMGAFSALLFSKINLNKNEFISIAVGDCCVFNVREDKLFFSYPITDPDEFSNRPYLIKSKDDSRSILKSNILVSQKYKLIENDKLFFMSDALAHWFLESNLNGEKPWNLLNNLFMDNHSNKFKNWLLENIKNKKIKNDDITLIIIELK